MEPNSKVKPVVAKVMIDEQKSDFAYWQTQSYQVRLVASERSRSEYPRWKYDSEPRLQRVYKIVKTIIGFAT